MIKDLALKIHQVSFARAFLYHHDIPVTLFELQLYFIIRGKRLYTNEELATILFIVCLLDIPEGMYYNHWLQDVVNF